MLAVWAFGGALAFAGALAYAELAALAAAGGRRVRLSAGKLRKACWLPDWVDLVRRRFQRSNRRWRRRRCFLYRSIRSRCREHRRDHGMARRPVPGCCFDAQARRHRDDRRAGAGAGARRQTGPRSPEFADHADRDRAAGVCRHRVDGGAVSSSRIRSRADDRADNVADRIGSGDVQLHGLERSRVRRRRGAESDAKRSAGPGPRNSVRRVAVPGAERALSARGAARRVRRSDWRWGAGRRADCSGRRPGRCLPRSPSSSS